MAPKLLPLNLVTKDCEELIVLLDQELSIVKEQLAVLAQHLDDTKTVCPAIYLPQESPSPPLCPSIPPSLPSSRPPTTCSINRTRPNTKLKSIASRSTRRSKRSNKAVITPPTLPEQCLSSRHLLQVVDEREEARAKARKRYLALMQKHIEEQLKELKERELIFKKKRERRESRDRAARLQQKPSRFKSNFMDDTSYLDNIHQSCFYKIVDMEHTLKKSGKLKTISELKSYWDYMLAPLKESFSQLKEQDHTHSPEHDLDGESCVDSWAITAMPQEEESKINATSNSVGTPTPHFIAHKLPELKPIKEILDEDRDEEVLNLHAHQRQRNIRQKRVHMVQVYQKAKANEMAMRSLLPEHPSFLTACVSTPTEVSSESPAPSLMPLPPITTHKHQSSLMEHHSKFLPLCTHKKKLEETKCPMRSSLERVSTKNEPVFVPLKMSDLLESSSVSLKVPSRAEDKVMWTNYVAAGK